MKVYVLNFLIVVLLSLGAFFAVHAQTLGNYPESSVQVGGNQVVLPADYPSGVSRTTAAAGSAFKGVLTVDPATGAVRVTNAQPAGNYTITVRGFSAGGASVSKTFTLRVLRQGCRDYSLTGNMGQFPVSPLTTESEPFYNAVGDFNADGKQDLIVADSAADKVNIFSGDGSGSFSNVAASPFAVSADRPGKLAVGDFNGDGKQDFAVNGSNNNKVSVYLGDGGNGFTEAPASPVNVCASPGSLTSADFNNDGKLDLAVACDTGQSVSVLLGAGDGSFSVNTIFLNMTVRGVVAGDFNGDGKADLAITLGQNVIIMNGSGDGTFTGGIGASIAGAPGDISQGDIDGDGDLDLAVGNPSLSFSSFHILRNDGAALNDFISPITFTGGAPDGNAIADINGDGRQDVFIGTNTSAWLVRLFTNPIASSFLSNSTRVSGFALGDFNGNGFLDLSDTEPFVNRMRVYGGGCGIQITSSSLPRGSLNAAYNFAVQQSGGTAPNTFGATGLPPGLSINTSTGVISGMPTAEGAFTVTVTLDDANGYSAIRQLVLYVGAPQIFIYPPTLPGGNIGQAYSQSISADYGTSPYSFSVSAGSLPNGLTLNPNGTLGGTPTAFGSFNFTITATDSANYAASRNYSISIGCSAALSALPNGTLGTNYLGNVTAAGTGVSSFTFAATGTLPSGLTLNPNGTFNGVPNALGTFDFTVTATGNTGCSGSRDYSVTIFPAQLKNYANAAVELGQNAVLSPAGSVANTKELTVAALGSFRGILTINQTTGAVSVTNASPAGVFPVTVSAVDTSGRIEAKTFNLTVQNRFSGSPIVFDRYSPVSGGGLAMVLGDVNGDGQRDVITANGDASTVSVIPGAGFGSFGATVNYSSQGSGAMGVAAGDVNGDGLSDIAVVNQYSKNFAVLLGNGAGGFSPEGAPVPVGNQAVRGGTLSWIAIADFNGDGRRDVAVTNAGAGSNVALFYRNAANNGFDAPQNLAASSLPTAMTTGDFNGDGRTDLVVGYDDIQQASVYYRQPDPLTGFQRLDVALFSLGAMSIAAGDVSGDGRADLVIGHGTSGGTSVLLNTGSSFSTSFSLFSIENGTGVAICNVDNTGKNDIVITDDNQSRLRWFSLNSGNTGFTTPQTLPKGGANTLPWALAATDFNGDGAAEILFSDLTTGEVRAVWQSYVFNTRPFEVMSRERTYTLSAGDNASALIPYLIAVGDFNGDSMQDVVTGNGNNPTISLLRGLANGQLSTTAAQFAFSTDPNAVANAIAVGDFNGDGRQDVAVNYADSTSLKLAIFQGDGAGSFTLSQTNFAGGGGGLGAGDFNGDGRTDLVLGGNNLRILLRNPQNTDFVVGAGSANIGAGEIKTADFNGDGKLDFLAAAGGAMTCFLGDGAGGFVQEGASYAVVDYIEAADFNGDGKTDIAGIKQGVPGSTMYVFLRNAANNGFTSETGSPYALGSDVFDMTSGDFDGDQRADIAFTHQATTEIYTRNAANNGFAPAVTNSDAKGDWLGVADLNRDGRLDLLVTTHIDTVSVLLRQSAINFDRRTLPNASTAASYNQTIRVGGGQTPYNFSVSGLPNGMSFTAFQDGLTLVGTPTQTGTFNVAVTVSDSTPFAEAKDDFTPQAANLRTQIFPLTVLPPTAARVSVSGRILTAGGQGIKNAFVSMTDANGIVRNVSTGSFGYFRFDNVLAGETYVVTVNAQRYVFGQNTQIIPVNGEITDVIFTADAF